MPEKSIYHITKSGDRYFLRLMKKISDQKTGIIVRSIK